MLVTQSITLTPHITLWGSKKLWFNCMQGELQETQLKNTESDLLTSKKAFCVYCCRVNAMCKSLNFTLLKGRENGYREF